MADTKIACEFLFDRVSWLSKHAKFERISQYPKIVLIILFSRLIDLLGQRVSRNWNFRFDFIMKIRKSGNVEQQSVGT